MESTSMISVGLVVLVVLVMGAFLLFESRKRARLVGSFGPEYGRALREVGPRKAERHLEQRAKRVAGYGLRRLGDGDRRQFSDAWASIQQEFVDDPGKAVVAADRLVTDVMRARGYPVVDFETRARDLSVDHAGVVGEYRAARAIAERHAGGEAGTEDLRQALVHYRALFRELLEEGSPAGTPLLS